MFLGGDKNPFLAEAEHKGLVRYIMYRNYRNITHVIKCRSTRELRHWTLVYLSIDHW